MALEVSWLTRHERGVMVAALAHYRAEQDRKKRVAALAKTRAIAGANAHVAGDLIRQLTDR